MQFMIFRKADQDTGAGVMRGSEGLQPSARPTGPEVEVEVDEMADFGAKFTPELRDAEQRMRAQQPESGMREQLAAAPGAWR